MVATSKMTNAWIFLNEDEPSGTNYNSPNSCYQTLIQNDVYKSLDMLFICFATTVQVGAQTVPSSSTAPAGSWTLEIGSASHPDSLTNQNYMDYVIRDARKNNPDIKIGITLNWGDENTLSQIFGDGSTPAKECAQQFAANLLAYLDHYKLDGFDIDWESPLCFGTSIAQLSMLLNAIGEAFRAREDKKFYLTLSPAEPTNLETDAINANVDFINLQLYSGFTFPQEFSSIGINPNLFAYGCKFESNHQTAEQAFQDNAQHYHYNIFTNWRLNSDNYEFEQAQQLALHKLVFGQG